MRLLGRSLSTRFIALSSPLLREFSKSSRGDGHGRIFLGRFVPHFSLVSHGVQNIHRIGFGDICPGNPDFLGRVFLTVFPLVGLGFFCGPILDLASSWKSQFPGGSLSLVTFTLAIGVSMLTVLEGLEFTEALHLCVVLGTTIGYVDDVGGVVTRTLQSSILQYRSGLVGTETLHHHQILGAL